MRLQRKAPAAHGMKRGLMRYLMRYLSTDRMTIPPAVLGSDVASSNVVRQAVVSKSEGSGPA